MARARDVVRFDVIRSLKKKTFWYTSIAPPVLILMIIVISFLSNQSAKNATQDQAAAYAKNAKIAVLDESGLLNQQIMKSQKIVIEPDYETGVAAVKAGRVDAFFYYPRDLIRRGVQVYAQDQGISFFPPYNAAATEFLRQNIFATIGKDISNVQALRVLRQPPSVTAVTYRDGQKSNALAEMIAPGLFLVFFLSMIILLSAMMIASTTEEKENRTVEILLTCAKARTLVLGKIMSIIVLGAIQVTIIAAPLLVYCLLFPKTFNLPGNITLAQIPLDPGRLLLASAFFAAGFVFYTTFVVGLGALFPNANEAGRFLGLSMIWAYVPFYIVSVIISTPHAVIVSIFTYFPLTAPTTVLLRNAVGALSTGEALTSLAIIIACVFLAIPFAVRAFRYGALEYGRRLSLKTLFRQI